MAYLIKIYIQKNGAAEDSSGPTVAYILKPFIFAVLSIVALFIVSMLGFQYIAIGSVVIALASYPSLMLYNHFSSKYKYLSELKTNGILVYNPVKWAHGPAQEEDTQLAMPWASWAKHSLFLTPGKYKLVVRAYGEPSGIYMPNMKVCVNSGKPAVFKLTKKEQDCEVEFETGYGFTSFLIDFQRTQEETMYITKITLKKLQ
jgi:hypothetical protein